MALIGFIIDDGVSTKHERCADTRKCDSSLSVVLNPIHQSILPCLELDIDKSNEIFTRFAGLSFRATHVSVDSSTDEHSSKTIQQLLTIAFAQLDSFDALYPLTLGAWSASNLHDALNPAMDRTVRCPVRG